MARSRSPSRPTDDIQDFRDRLGRLTHHQACQMLGVEGETVLRRGGLRFSVDPTEDVYVGGDLFRVRVRDPDLPSGKAVVVITMMSGRDRKLHAHCDQCDAVCDHAGAALQTLLAEKTTLGLAAPPDEETPLELLTPQELLARAFDERRRRADEEPMTVRSLRPAVPWTDYVVTSERSGRSYRVAVYGERPGEFYCSCPDFRTNRLGVCKHSLHALDKIRRRFKAAELAKPYESSQTTVYVDYRDPTGVRFKPPTKPDADLQSRLAPHLDQAVSDAEAAVRLVQQLQQAGYDVLVYPDAEAWLDRQLAGRALERLADEIRRDPASHPLRRSLLKVDLLPYQMEGIAFVAAAGRSILADDMGLGKTIQAIGAAELLARETGLSRVLVVCPASLKSQWRDEIRRFSDRSVQLVQGRNEERAAQYAGGAFFTVCNYEQVLRDLSMVEAGAWDLIVLDEGQRIKNWQSKTSRVIQSLRSRFAIVLSGTPLENNLDELYNIVRFVDDQALGPAYEFFHRHRTVDKATGRITGYQRLDELRERLRPVLLRRTRAAVIEQLPERTTTVVRIRPTEEQLEVHNGHLRTVARIVAKKHLTEIDLLTLQKALLMCRMAADSTVLVDKQPPGYSSKLDRLGELLEEFAARPDGKAIIFSEWRSMLNLIEPLLRRTGLDFVRLDGQIAQTKRAALVKRFQNDPNCRAFLMTNAGSTGLNLQAADVVFNCDLPWNPAVLEQRIARAHRMGQRRPVHAYLLVTEETLEERMLDTLASKQELALAALDPDSDVVKLTISGGLAELKKRLERLLGVPAPAPVDESNRQRVEREAQEVDSRRERVAAAGGQMLGAALEMLGQLVAAPDAAPPAPETLKQIENGLADCIERDAAGRPQLRITLPDDAALARLAQTLARLLNER